MALSESTVKVVAIEGPAWAANRTAEAPVNPEPWIVTVDPTVACEGET